MAKREYSGTSLRALRLTDIDLQELVGSLDQNAVRVAVGAWWQLGIVASTSDLAASDPEELKAALAAAAARGLGLDLDDEAAADLVRKLQDAALRRTFDEPLRRAGSPLADLLDVPDSCPCSEPQRITG